jgi:hypothetical protein
MRRRKLQRERVLNLIVREVRRFVREGSTDSIEEVMSALGWSSSVLGRTDKELARAVMSLAPFATDDELAVGAHIAICRRELNKGTDYAERDNTARRILERWGVAYAACGCLAQHASTKCCALRPER